MKLATAESCTGGMVAAALTDIAGSSDVVERGFVTYSNEAKSELLGVPPAFIAAHGAVSAEVAAAMAEGALARAPVDLSVAITGIAGPGGGTAMKPVGLVWFACARRDGKIVTETHIFSGDRAAVRLAATQRALEMVLESSGIRVIKLDASGWTAPLDFYDALLTAIGAPNWHGRSVDALVDSMLYGGINAIEAPYRIWIVGAASLPEDVRKELDIVIVTIDEQQGVEKEIEFQLDA
jgi:nicotinamide-nucleotide amidase